MVYALFAYEFPSLREEMTFSKRFSSFLIGGGMFTLGFVNLVYYVLMALMCCFLIYQGCKDEMSEVES